MTPEEIKKIAEEYAKIVMNPHRSDPDMTGLEWQAEFDACAEAAEDILGTISTRFYLVEKGKVEHEMINANQNIDLFNSYPKERYANEGVKRVLTKLFGPDIRKEEEE